VPDPGEPSEIPFSTNPVLQQKMTAIRADLNVVANKRNDAVAGYQ
jgi:hypothetical protein